MNLNGMIHILHHNIFHFLVLFLSFFCLSSQVFATETSIKLNVRERYGVARTNAPVTVGVPLPEDNGITSTDNLKITSYSAPTHTNIACQFRVLERWGGKTTDTSKNIRWVLADFQVTVSASSDTEYYLWYNDAATYTPPTHSNAISVTDNEGTIEIDTGAATFEINETAFNIFNSVDISGTEFISSSVGARIRDSFNDELYASRNTDTVEIEESGDLRTVIYADGWHQNDEDTETAFYKWITRIHFYAGKSTARVVHTISNTPATARGALAFEDYVIAHDFNLSGTLTYNAYTDGEETDTVTSGNSVTLEQMSDGTAYWNNTGDTETRDQAANHYRGFKLLENATTADSGNWALGLLDISDSSNGVTVAVKNFWQLFPKNLYAHYDGTFEIGILPDDFITETTYYHYIEDQSQLQVEILYNFHTGTYSATHKAEMYDMLHPIIPVAEPEHYADARASSVLEGNIYHYEHSFDLYDLTVPEYIELGEESYPLINIADDRYDKREIEGFYGQQFYGPRVEADRNGGGFEGPVEHFINFMQIGYPGAAGDKYRWYKQDYHTQYLLEDYDLYWGGIAFVNHWMHNRAGNDATGFSRESVPINTRTQQKAYYFYASYPRWGGRDATDSTHTLSVLGPDSTQDGVTQPTRDWFFMDQMHVVLNHVRDYYHLTGDMAVLEYGHSAGEMIENMLSEDVRTDGDYDTTIPYGTALRQHAWPIYGLTDMYRLTGEDQYLDYAEVAAEELMSVQNKQQGYHSVSLDYDEYSGYSFPQFAKSVLALGRLWKLTGNEDYFDACVGYMNYLVHYVTASNYFLDGYNWIDANGDPITNIDDALAYYDSTHHQKAETLNGLQSSNNRLYFPLAWLYEYTGDDKYIDILDANYTYENNSQPVIMTDVPWLQLYLYRRYNNPKSDTTPPADVSDLAITSPAPGSVKLTWTTPAASSGGRIQAKYGTLPIVDQMVYPDQSATHQNWWAATNIDGEPDPINSTSQNVTVTGLDTATTYYFAVRVFDDANNWTDVSNVVSGLADGADESPGIAGATTITGGTIQ